MKTKHCQKFYWFMGSVIGLLNPDFGVQVLADTLSFLPHVDYFSGNNPVGLQIGDVNRDGKPDLIVANYYAHTVSVLLGKGNGAFLAKVDFSTGIQSAEMRGPHHVRIGDVNRDGKTDLITTNYDSTTVSVLLNDGR